MRTTGISVIPSHLAITCRNFTRPSDCVSQLQFSSTHFLLALEISFSFCVSCLDICLARYIQETQSQDSREEAFSTYVAIKLQRERGKDGHLLVMSRRRPTFAAPARCKPLSFVRKPENRQPNINPLGGPRPDSCRWEPQPAQPPRRSPQLRHADQHRR